MERFVDAPAIRRLNRVEPRAARRIDLRGKQIELGSFPVRCSSLPQAAQAECVQTGAFGCRAVLERVEAAVPEKMTNLLARQPPDGLEQVGVTRPEGQFQMAPLGAAGRMIGEVDGLEPLLHQG